MAHIARHRAAIRRTALSRPVRLAMEVGVLSSEHSFFDYGCGYGDDVDRLSEAGVQASGWDPHYRPDHARHSAQVVNLGFVLNVIEDPRERLTVLQDAWDLTEEVLVVGVLVSVDARGGAVPFGDGVVTTIGTFQKYFEQSEIEELLRHVCGVEPVALDMGVFAVSRSPSVRARLLARQFRRRSRLKSVQVAAAFRENRSRLEPLIDFMAQHGRWPAKAERPPLAATVEPFGGFGRAQRLLQTALPESFFKEARSRCRNDLLVLLALSQFRGGIRMRDLPEPIQKGVRAHFGTFRDANADAVDFLYSTGDMNLLRFAAKAAPFGKLLPQALYVHNDCVDLLPPLLRVYEGCARRLVGAHRQAEIVKLGLHEPVVSYLRYPTFEKDPHPALKRSLRVHLQSFRVSSQDFSKRPNPPILHRKDAFLHSNHPLFEKFERFTRQEERFGLYQENRGSIGTRIGWERRLRATGVTTRGHRIVRVKPTDASEE